MIQADALQRAVAQVSPLAQSLRISEIFFSLQGETSRVGLPTVFIRLTGCPLRCGYCDTEYAFQGGETLAISAILKQVEQYNPHYVTVTGGEPLAQKNSLALLTSLCDTGYSVSLETSGALDISKVDSRVSRILDIKTHRRKPNMLPFTLSSLLGRKNRSARRGAPRAQEPADMGTAFGMEQWLDERDHGTKAAAPQSLAAPTAMSSRWVPRWLLPSRLPRG